MSEQMPIHPDPMQTRFGPWPPNEQAGSSLAEPSLLDSTALETLEHAERVLDVMSTFYRHSPTWKQLKGSECLERLKNLRVTVMSNGQALRPDGRSAKDSQQPTKEKNANE